jgi:hypothetical protein
MYGYDLHLYVNEKISITNSDMPCRFCFLTNQVKTRNNKSGKKAASASLLSHTGELPEKSSPTVTATAEMKVVLALLNNEEFEEGNIAIGVIFL